MSLRSDVLILFPEAREHNGYIRIKCPYHKYGQELHPSLSILLEDKGSLKAGYARCFACGWVGSFRQIAEDRGYQYVPDNTKTNEVDLIPLNPVQLERPVYKEQVPHNFSEYLYSRGIDAETQKEFRTFERTDERKIYMPVFARDGRFLYANARSTESKRFFIPPNVTKTLAGLEMVDMNRPLAICESQIDAMTFYSAGFCRAVATLGATGIASLRSIKGATGPFFIAFDADEAGELAAKKAIDLLGAYRCIRIDFGEYKDANNLWQAVGFDASKFMDYIETRLRRVV